MTNEIIDLDELEAEPGPSWSPGRAEDGIDARLELARLESGTRIAVRDPRHPDGPELVFSQADWVALVSPAADVLDLRRDASSQEPQLNQP